MSKPGLAPGRRKSVFKALEKLFENAKKHNPDFILIAGDLFEDAYTGLRTITDVNSLFASVPDTKIVMISGNHDSEASNSPYITFDWSDNTYFLGSGERSIYFEDLNTEVFGHGWVSGSGHNQDPARMELNPDRINILLFHGDIDLDIDGGGYNTLSSDFLKSKGFDYVAAGHNHKRREYGGLIFNPGSLEPLGFDEPGPHGYYHVALSKCSPAKAGFVRASSIEYLTIHIDIGESDSDDSVIDLVKEGIENPHHLYKVILTGRKGIDYSPDLSYIGKQLDGEALFIKLEDLSGVDFDMERLKNMKGLKGTFAKVIAEKMENTDEKGKVMLEKALHYGIEAIENKNVEPGLEVDE
jgi:DNA repair exonuclease SbcCD nuclease subunit